MLFLIMSFLKVTRVLCCHYAVAQSSGSCAFIVPLPHEHLLPPTRTCYLPRVPIASYENLLPTMSTLLPTTNTLLPPTRTCCLYLSPRFRDLFEDIPELKDTLGNEFKVH